MSYIDWDESFSVKIGHIDEQHREMMRHINMLYCAMEERSNGDRVSRLIDDLIQYTKFHFNTEEELIISHSYPEYKIHKAAHDSIMDQISEIREGLDGGAIKLSPELIDFLYDWLVTHIIDTDRRYMTFLNSRGIY